jgi:UDP-glucose:(heptosyl)LPS alpha-1,3-glucosyltransferase
MRQFSTRVGGGERFAVKLAQGLLEKGLDVELWGGSLEPGLGLEACFRKISYFRKPSSLKVASFCAGFQRLSRTRNADHIFGITQVYPVDLYRVGGGVYRHWLRTLYPDALSRFFRMLIRPVHVSNLILERKILSHPRLKKVVVNSRLEKDNLLKHYPIVDDQVEVIYNGVDLERFHPRGQAHRDEVRRDLETDEDAFVVLFPSHNFKRKGLGTLVRALAGLKNKNVLVWVAGKDRTEPFEALASRLGVVQQIRFLGRRSDIERLYGAADTMVLPTQYDSFSNVVLEALACDLPVITTRSNGAAEALEAGVNGFVMKRQDDAEELAELIEKVKASKRGLAGEARKRAEEFSVDKCISSYAALLSSL